MFGATSHLQNAANASDFGFHAWSRLNMQASCNSHYFKDGSWKEFTGASDLSEQVND